MKTIFKYPIKIVGSQQITFPVGYEVVHIGLDPQGTPCIWAEVSPLNPVEDTRIFVIGTGTTIPNSAIAHLGSFIQGDFVWHIYR